jgi:ataxin-3
MNLGQHWFTLRKFASNNDLWFNVNSFLPKPERVSKLYLGLQIHEAQREGYSVFAVLPAGDHYDPTEPFLPNCKADDFFTSNAHLAYTGFSGTLQASGSGPQTSTSTSSSSNGSRPRSESFDSLDADRRPARRRRISEDDEDEMLKRAIEASMQEENQRAAVTGKPASSARAPVQVVEISDDSDSDEDDDEVLSKSLQAGAKLNGASKGTTLVLAPDEDEAGFEEDAPTVEELRLKRLARFGAR